MKALIVILFASLFFHTSDWLTSFEKAKNVASEKHELILLNFSGSDWCLPCIQLKRKIFDSDAFNSFAKDFLVLVNADFPRLNKNKLSKENVNQNESLADKYNSQGKFPYTLLLTADGKVLKEWDGLPDISPAEFVAQINSFVNVQHKN